MICRKSGKSTQNVTRNISDGDSRRAVNHSGKLLLERAQVPPFQRGVALFNAGNFFEAHEALEDAWRASPQGSSLRRHLQGLTQLAVAFHHQSCKNVTGARSVLDRALRNLSGAEDSFPDLDLNRLRIDLADWQRHLSAAVQLSKCPELPHIGRRDAAH